MRARNGKDGRTLRASAENGLGEVVGKVRVMFELIRRRELLFVLGNTGMKRVKKCPCVHRLVRWVNKLFKML